MPKRRYIDSVEEIEGMIQNKQRVPYYQKALYLALKDGPKLTSEVFMTIKDSRHLCASRYSMTNIMHMTKWIGIDKTTQKRPANEATWYIIRRGPE